MALKNLVPLGARDRLRPWLRWPLPLWRLRGQGGITLGGRRYQFANIAGPPHDWWAWRARAGVWEPEVIDFLVRELRPGDVFFDVGVYIGMYSILAADRIGPTGQVVGFELDPVSLEDARRNLRLNRLSSRVRLVAAGVGDGSVVRLDPAHAGLATSHLAATGVEVTTVRLDDWCEQNRVWPDILKIDIEGGEAGALGEHARQAVTRARAVVLELHEEALAEQGRTVQEILDWLASTGKTVASLGGRAEHNFNMVAT